MEVAQGEDSYGHHHPHAPSARVSPETLVLEVTEPQLLQGPPEGTVGSG